MAIKFANDAETVLAGGISATATALTVSGGKGALFPALSGIDFFYVTLVRKADGLNEIVKVTARSTDVFTIVREQDNTSGKIFALGDFVSLRMNAASLETFINADDDVNQVASSINGTVHTEAAHATTSDIWTGGNTCLLSGGAVTFTDVANAPQAGAVRYVVANAAHVITDNAALEVDGNANYTCAANDVLMFTAKTTSTFRVNLLAHGDTTGDYVPSAVAITGGTINGTTIGASTPAAGDFTTLDATGQVTGAGFTGTLDGVLGGGTPAAASVTTVTATGDITMTGKSVNEAVHTEAAHATTSDIWTGGNTCLLSGSAVTFTDVANAPQAGAVREVIANAAHVITDNAALEVDGNANYTCAVGDLLRFEAKTTSTFRVSVMAHGDGAGSGDAKTANPLSQFAATSSAQLKGVISDETGSGALAFATSPTLVTPALGTPASGALTNCTFPTLNQSTSGNAATVTTNANLTGHITSSGNAAVLGSFSSAQLKTALSDETGSGVAVFATSPTLVTPALGTPASGVATNLSGTAASLTAGTVTTNANLTGHITSSGNAAVLGSFTSAQLSTALTNETGSGAACFATAPTIVGLTATGDITMSAKSVNDAVHSEAAHATTSDIWTGGNTCLLTGSVVTFTDIADAPQAGAIRYVVANVAHVITDNAALEVDGNANYTCAVGDVLMFTAKTTSTFRVNVLSHGDSATGGGGGGDALTSNPLSQFAATSSAQLRGVLSDETGSGAAVFGTSPTFTGTVNAAALNTSGAVVFNDAGADVDFRVEGDTNANLLVVDASADAVGIGTDAPETYLHVFKDSSGASTDGSAVAHFESSGSTVLQVSAGTSNDCHIAFGDSGNQNIGSIAYLNNGNHMVFRADNGEKMRLTSGGDLTLSSGAVNATVHTEAAHATTSDIWTGGNTCLLSGSAVTFTDVADAPQAGAVRYVVANAAHVFTDNTALEVDGNENYTCAANDVLMITAKSTSTFRVNILAHGDSASGGGSAANEGFTVNINAVAADYTLATNSNASSVGPMTVNTGVTVTIPTGSRWVIL